MFRSCTSVCNTGLDERFAAAACKMLGKAGGVVRSMSDYGTNPSLPILMADVRCTYGAADLNACTFNAVNSVCEHAIDAGIDCEEPRKPAEILRLWLGCKTDRRIHICCSPECVCCPPLAGSPVAAPGCDTFENQHYCVGCLYDGAIARSIATCVANGGAKCQVGAFSLLCGSL